MAASCPELTSSWYILPLQERDDLAFLVGEPPLTASSSLELLELLSGKERLLPFPFGLPPGMWADRN